MLADLPLDFRCHHFMDLAVQLQMHVYGRNQREFERWERHKDALASVEDVRRWQQHVRRCALEALGGLPADDTPLNPQVCGELKADGFRVRKVMYESQPGALVTAALYLPDRLSGKTGAVLFVCGHSEEAKGSPEYQAVCQRLALNGLVVLAVDPPGQGERKSYLDSDGREIVRWGTTEHDYAGLQCWWLGQSAARYFIHDARRGIDLLAGLPEVDAGCIGVTGNSGGGTQSCWLMMVEPRLAAAAPGTFLMRRLEYMWTGQAQDSEQIIPAGTLNGLDHEDFLIAMAPRPVRVLAAEYDYFCLEGTRVSVERARRIYRLFGKEENLSLATDRMTHQYSPALARAATEFFCRHLIGKPAAEVEHRDPAPFPPDKLWCSRRGQILLDVPDVKRTFERNLAEYEALPKRPVDAGKAREWLKERVYRYRGQCDLNPRWPWDEKVGDYRVAQGFWFTEPGICNAGFLALPAGGEYGGLTLALFDNGTTELDARRLWLADMLTGGQAVLALDVRGFGNLAPRPINPIGLSRHYGTLFKLVSDLVFIGDDLCSMRVYDLLRAVALAASDPFIALGERPISIFGNGAGGFYAYLAAALEPRIAAAEVEDTLFSLASLVRTRYYNDERVNQLLVFGMAAQFDLPDLLPLFSGRELVIRRPRHATGRIIPELERC